MIIGYLPVRTRRQVGCSKMGISGSVLAFDIINPFTHTFSCRFSTCFVFLNKAGLFVHTEHYIQALNRLSGGAFGEIVNCGNRNHPAGALVIEI